MTEPLSFEPTQQRSAKDCAVAVIKMLCEVSYEQAQAAFPKRAKVHKLGASDRQLTNAAKRLGHRLRFIVDGDLSEIVGILKINAPGRYMHVVMLAKGCVYDPGAGLLWTDIAAYLQTGNYTVVGVFVREEEQ
jgi:ABC-type bacteriocin/lantibiotic exporter with double-glycine peptidase domain